MHPVLHSVIRTAAGKAVMGIAVVGLGVGSAAAAGADIPLLVPADTTQDAPTCDDTTDPAVEATCAGQTSDDVTADVDTPDVDESPELDEVESGDDEADEVETDDADEVETDDADVATDPAVDEQQAEHPDNHGGEVSDFVHTTELEGCEKGQAVSELASGNAADHRNNTERDDDPCQHGEGEDAASGAVDDTDTDELADEADEADEADDDSAEHGKSAEHSNSGKSAEHGNSGKSGKSGG
jgi:hypothetical protein